jgi:hypothetical protein
MVVPSPISIKGNMLQISALVKCGIDIEKETSEARTENNTLKNAIATAAH